jgi:hypothetical protein
MTELREALDKLGGILTSSSSPGPNMVTVSDRPRQTVSDAPPAVTTLSGTAGELVKLKAEGTRRRLIIGGALALLLAGGGLVVWRASSSSDVDPEPRAAAGGPTAARPLDAGAPRTPDLAAPDLIASDAARGRKGRSPAARRSGATNDTARRAKPKKPRRPGFPAKARTPAKKTQPAKDPRPKGPQDAPKDRPKDEEKKNYFNEL